MYKEVEERRRIKLATRSNIDLKSTMVKAQIKRVDSGVRAAGKTMHNVIIRRNQTKLSTNAKRLRTTSPYIVRARVKKFEQVDSYQTVEDGTTSNTDDVQPLESDGTDDDAALPNGGQQSGDEEHTDTQAGDSAMDHKVLQQPFVLCADPNLFAEIIADTKPQLSSSGCVSSVPNLNCVWPNPPVISCHVLLDIIKEMPGKSAFEIAELVKQKQNLSADETAHVRLMLSALLIARRDLALDMLALLPDSSEQDIFVKSKVCRMRTLISKTLNQPKQKPFEC